MLSPEFSPERRTCLQTAMRQALVQASTLQPDIINYSLINEL
jgi:hypothetical protein